MAEVQDTLSGTVGGLVNFTYDAGNQQDSIGNVARRIDKCLDARFRLLVDGHLIRAYSQPAARVLISVVGASTVDVGLIEGLAEATAAIAKVFSGALSDRIGKRKLLVGIGYGLAAVTKPVFPLASTAWEVLAARFVDRIGKGIRDAPRDALIADITPPAIRGAGYGIRQALDTVGGFAGPLLAVP